jgi:ATP-binding cassette subfamily B multidrug efflux pump
MSDQSPEKKKRLFDLRLLGRLLVFAHPHRKKLYGAVLLAVLLAVLAPLRPWLIQLTINRGIQPGVELAWLKGPVQVVLGLALIQFSLLLLESVCRFALSYLTASIGQQVVRDMRTTTFRHILGFNLRQFDTTPIGTLTTRTINDIEAVNEVFSDGLIPIIADLLTILAVLAYMFHTDWSLTLVCLAPFPFLLLATYYFKESVNRSFMRVRNAVAALNTFVQEHITGMALVQAFAAEEREFSRFRKINAEHRNANVRAILAYAIFFPAVELVLALSLGLLVWWAGGRQQVELAGNVTAFILCLNLLFRPLRVIADKFNVLQMGMIAGERVFGVLDNADLAADTGTRTPAELRGSVVFDRVCFSYGNGRDVLSDISFRIEKGQTLALVGDTGSGKTTLISLINRLYPLTQGQITIDDVPIESYRLDYLRSRIAVVLQDVFLFSGSVYDNITLRNPDIAPAQVEEVARQIGIHDFIMKLPGQYQYAVMERGATLSLGQRQLISFARALLYNPAILILDEATSSVDTESEQLIEQAIAKMVKGRTSIIIAHRLSTIRRAHQIIVLQQGRIVEAGTHEQLMQLGGAYTQLHNMQFEREEKAG